MYTISVSLLHYCTYNVVLWLNPILRKHSLKLNSFLFTVPTPTVMNDNHVIMARLIKFWLLVVLVCFRIASDSTVSGER